jgi:hypothetical protein
VRVLSQHIFPLFLVSLAPDLAAFREVVLWSYRSVLPGFQNYFARLLLFCISQKDKKVLAFGGY